MTMSAEAVAVIVVVALAPLAIVALFAILRGYTVDIHLNRNDRRRRGGDDNHET